MMRCDRVILDISGEHVAVRLLCDVNYFVLASRKRRSNLEDVKYGSNLRQGI